MYLIYIRSSDKFLAVREKKIDIQKKFRNDQNWLKVSYCALKFYPNNAIIALFQVFYIRMQLSLIWFIPILLYITEDVQPKTCLSNKS